MKKNILFSILCFVFSIFLFANSFYLTTLKSDENFLTNSEKIYDFQNSEYFYGYKLTFCTGSFTGSDSFNVFSEINSGVFNKPLTRVLNLLGTDAILPSSIDLAYLRENNFKTAENKYIPMIMSDKKTNFSDFYLKVEMYEKVFCIINITTVPSDWYENLKDSIDLNTVDYFIFFMDNPDSGIVPQTLKSRSVVLDRKTAIYRVDLQYGILLTEISLQEPKYKSTEIDEIKSEFDSWQETPYEIGSSDYMHYVQIPFFKNLGLMFKNHYKSDLVFFELPDKIDSSMTPADILNTFADYSLCVVHLENSSIRKLLERSASSIEFDGITWNLNIENYYLSLYGEPYFIDITQPKGERVIIKTFDRSQKIVCFMKNTNIGRLFPKAVIENYPFSFDLIYAAKNAYLKIIPDWRVVTQPYFSNYRVEDGDTLSGIAEKLGITVKAIKAYNPDLIDMYLVPGTYLKVHLPYEFE